MEAWYRYTNDKLTRCFLMVYIRFCAPEKAVTWLCNVGHMITVLCELTNNLFCLYFLSVLLIWCYFSLSWHIFFCKWLPYVKLQYTCSGWFLTAILDFKNAISIFRRLHSRPNSIAFKCSCKVVAGLSSLTVLLCHPSPCPSCQQW